MTTPAGWALQKAIHSALSSSPELLELLGEARIYDDVPRGADYPYVTFGPATLRETGTDGERGEEHIVVLHVWSRAAGRREAQEIAAAVSAALHDQPLPLTEHRLVNLRHETSEVRRDGDGETYRAIVRLRAVTEPA